MKRVTLFLSLCLLIGNLSPIKAQKIGVVDTDYLLNHIPEYKEAENRFNQQIKAWQSELELLQTELERKKELLDNERILLIGEQLKIREKEIDDLQKKLNKHLKEKFAAEGEINNLRTNMVRPFQDKIWNAIKSVADKNNLGIILDKNSNSSVLFLDKKYDYTDKVLNLLVNKGSGLKKNIGEVKKRKR